MPHIPINPSEMPSEERFEPLDEGLTYRGTIEMLGETRPDKNGHEFFSVRVRVSEPEQFARRVVYDNYVSLPWAPSPTDDADARKRAAQSGGRLGDLARSAQVKGGPQGWNTDDLVNCEITFTISNEEYQGRIRSRIRDYLLPREFQNPPVKF